MRYKIHDKLSQTFQEIANRVHSIQSNCIEINLFFKRQNQKRLNFDTHLRI